MTQAAVGRNMHVGGLTSRGTAGYRRNSTCTIFIFSNRSPAAKPIIQYVIVPKTMTW